LGKSDFTFARIAVLNDEVAGVPCQDDVVHLPLGTISQNDHFVDINKMVWD
jgi:hypothetical protein